MDRDHVDAHVVAGSGVSTPRARRTAELPDEHCRWEYDNLPYAGHRLADGGWNCAWVAGSTRSSFHSTLNSLTGLLAWESATGGSDATRAARREGEEYLLRRGRIRRLSTGEPVGPWVARFAYRCGSRSTWRQGSRRNG